LIKNSLYFDNNLDLKLQVLIKRTQETQAVQNNNETISCLKCSIPMVLRRAKKGQNVGKEFYGCTNYPKCKEVINKDV